MNVDRRITRPRLLAAPNEATATPEASPHATDGAESPRRDRLSGVGTSLLLYVALFAVLGAPWLLAAHRGAPSGYLGNAADERLVVWVLAWVAHAAGSEPERVLDANINYPAPGQLTGTEHFLSWQVLFAPFYALTRNPMLAANATLFLSYPLAALAMQRLLLALGCTAGVGWVVGALFALGPYRVPAHFHLLQYSNLFVPLVALAITRLRDRQSALNVIVLAIVLGLTMLSSYYMAVIGGVAAASWGLCELLRRADGNLARSDAWSARVRFAVLAISTAAVVSAVFLFLSLPYLSRPEMAREVEWSVAGARRAEYMLSLFLGIAMRSGGPVALWLAPLGAIALLSSAPGTRNVALRGLWVLALGQLMGHGPVLTVDGTPLPTPFALIADSPLRFFRYPTRFAVLAGFGLALLVAAALQVVACHLGRRASAVALAAVLIALLATQGRALSGPSINDFAGQVEPAYDMVARISRGRGPGPLLELPYLPPVNRDEELGTGTEGDSMIGSTRHWLPLVLGTTGYQPPHRALVMRELRELPRPRALERLVDMTGLRWILLQPVERWPERMRAQRAAIRTSPLLKSHAEENGWELLRVKSAERNRAWFDAIAAGPRPDRTLLGTPLAPIAPEDAVAEVRGSIVSPVKAGGVAYVALILRNHGEAIWPVSVASDDPESRGAVHLVSEWRHADAAADSPPVWTSTALLPADVMPGEEMRFNVWMQVPGEPGEYDVTVRTAQRDGPTFAPPPVDGPAGVPLRGRVVVTSPDA